jgi:hypothetical protein
MPVSQIFILVLLIGGAVAMGFFLIGFGIYHLGKNAGRKEWERK